jgi:excinuclease UvrABC nuclease subunit
VNVSEQLQAKLDTLPTKPGVYLMKGTQGDVIYVGKTVNLRSRVRSYFQRASQHHAKTRRLTAEVTDFDWIITENELEALVLENVLIKQHRPRFNVRLRDDKTYPGDRHAPHGAGRRLVLRSLRFARNRAPDVGWPAAHLSLPHLPARDHGEG